MLIRQRDMLTRPATRTLLLAEAATFAVAASIHFGAFVSGYAHRRAGIAETVTAVVLLIGTALTSGTSAHTARSAFLGAQAFAALGVCVGLFTIAIGVGPRTAPDIVYHLAILATLIAGLAFARRTVADRMKEKQMSEDLRFDVLLRSEQTGEALAVTENMVPAGWAGPPLHHHDFDETFYVLDGELTFQLGDELSSASAGDLVFVARGAHHTLANHGTRAARYLLVITPAGFERYFDRLSAELTGTEPPPESRKPYPETIVVGPPIDPAGKR